MTVTQKLKKGRLYFDGGMGTLLQEAGLKAGEYPENWNISHPEVIRNIHRAYLEAGSDIISANTFGANGLKFDNLDEIIGSALANARSAVDSFGEADKYVAFDMGPLGKMLEPIGELTFEKAVEIFAESVRLAVRYGADLIIIETMNDSYETKAAVLAAKENSDLPIFVTNVFDENRKLMTGASPKAMIAMLESLGVQAIGMNCSLGPRQMVEIAREYTEYSSLPVIVNPNAGLPRQVGGKTVFNVDSEEFSDCMREIASLGVCVLGGCCGTTPEYIRKTVEKTADIPFAYPEKKNHTLVSSYTHAVEIGKRPILIGERINPTGKSKFKQALRDGNIQYIVSEGITQQEKGVHILDVNVGLPEIDEDKMLTDAVKELQAVLDLPLQLDSVKASSLEKAMRIYNGKPLINSVNGKQESMDEILPLVKKYGGTLIALTIDEKGIPDTAEGRLAIAKKILLECEKYGIDRKDVIVDPLAMTVSSDDNSGRITLDAIELIEKELGIHTSLGVSNISFGLPGRPAVNAAFMTMAMTKGLSCAIMNPYSAEMMQSYHTFLALNGLDKGCAEYIQFASTVAPAALTAASASPAAETVTQGSELKRSIIKGLKEQAYEAAKSMLKTMAPLDIINDEIVPALDTVGKRFEEKTMYLPQLLMSAEAASKAFDAVKNAMDTVGAAKGKILLATVKGDIHDIGKNIVRVLLENYGYDVVDLGRDVEPQAIVDAAREQKISLVGLSALMTTTVEAMEKTIKLLAETLPQVKTVVGGAVLTQEYADMIGATYYAKDAMETVRIAESLDLK